MRARRKALAPEERERTSKIVCAKLLNALGGCSQDETVAVYLASPDEIDLSGFILEMLGNGVAVAAPRWNGETYELARVKSLSEDDLRRGPMNILEPAKADLVEPTDVAAWIIPGLAFTNDGRRLGYGGGWYDRLLATSEEESLKIGVAHEFQLVDKLPQEPHDIILDRIVTSAIDDSASIAISRR